jgi:hypothetical protein
MLGQTLAVFVDGAESQCSTPSQSPFFHCAWEMMASVLLDGED